MKTSDLKIGTAYAIGSRQNRGNMQALLTRAVVVETKVERRVYNGGYYPSTTNDGVRIEITHRRGQEVDTREVVVRPAEILMPWADYDEQARKDYIAAIARSRDDKRERMARVQSVLQEVLGENFRAYGTTHVKLTLDQIETLIFTQNL